MPQQPGCLQWQSALKITLTINPSTPVTTNLMQIFKHSRNKVYTDRSTHQNLNSGSLLMKGRNSSFCLVGKEGPSSEENIEMKKSTTKINLPHRLFLIFKKNNFHCTQRSNCSVCVNITGFISHQRKRTKISARSCESLQGEFKHHKTSV